LVVYIIDADDTGVTINDPYGPWPVSRLSANCW
jgi:hypothetical protein